MRFIVFFTSFILHCCVFVIVRWIPKDKNLAIIGSSLGQHFNDNSKYFYLYFHCIRQEKKHKLFWITANKEVFKMLLRNKLPVKYLYSFSGILTATRASKAFLSYQIQDISPSLLAGAFIVQLWHGTPLKKIGLGGDWKTNHFYGKVKYFFYSLFPFYYYMRCDEVIASCAYSSKYYQKAFHLSRGGEKNVVLLGQPRNDVFNCQYHFPLHLFSNEQLLKKYKKKYDTVVAWLPTHRKGQKKTIVDLILQSRLDFSKLDLFCKTNNILFVIKSHFLESSCLSSQTQGYENIFLYDDIDPYVLLKYTDILITDYSSIYFDFLLTKKPVIFAPFDYEEYLSATDFYLPYDEMIVGKKCFSWEEIFTEVLFIQNGQDKYIAQRQDFLKTYSFPSCSAKAIYERYFA